MSLGAAARWARGEAGAAVAKAESLRFKRLEMSLIENCMQNEILSSIVPEGDFFGALARSLGGRVEMIYADLLRADCGLWARRRLRHGEASEAIQRSAMPPFQLSDDLSEVDCFASLGVTMFQLD